MNVINLPLRLTLGDTIEFTDVLNDYTASDYRLDYHFSDGSTVQGVTDGEGWKITITVDSIFPKMGNFDFTRTVTNLSDSKRLTVDSGQVRVLPDPTDLPDGYDARSHAEIAFENIQRVLEGSTSTDRLSYSIAGRSLASRSADELLKLRDYYSIIVKKERRKELAKRGVRPVNGKTVTFGNPYNSGYFPRR